ncbi:MAG: carbohydrate ABC transporter substrate-binding protein, partial [Lacrimispora celerecrescens]|nr:carbohydrate ABC transporter substrate-binding protein [Lacrimispora celerecrescens]
MKKLALAAMTGFIAVSVLGCSKAPQEPVEATITTTAQTAKETETKGSTAASTGVTIEFLYNLNGESVSDAIQDVCRQFTEETGIGVEAVMPGSNFSDIMKTRMASNQLPDVWTTHGWAVARYAEYLSPLNDFSFASHISPSIKEQITDEEGTLYTLPIDMDLTGMIYNENVL